MKSLVAGFLGAALFQLLSLGISDAAPAPKIRVLEEFTLKSGDGKYSIDMRSGPNYVGLWVSGPSGHSAMYSGANQGTWIGVLDGKTKGCSFAICLSGKEDGFLQLATKEETQMYSPQTLINKLK